MEFVTELLNYLGIIKPTEDLRGLLYIKVIAYILCTILIRRAASIPKGKGDAYLQMKLVYNHFAPIFLYFLQWMDCSCSCLFSGYLNLFHVLVYKVCYLFPVQVLNVEIT